MERKCLNYLDQAPLQWIRFHKWRRSTWFLLYLNELFQNHIWSILCLNLNALQMDDGFVSFHLSRGCFFENHQLKTHVLRQIWTLTGHLAKNKTAKTKKLARVVLAEAYNIAKCLPRLEN